MKSLLVPALLVVLAGALYFGYVPTLAGGLKLAEDKVASYDDALSSAKELHELELALADRYKQFSVADLERLSKMIPNQVDNVRLIIDMDGIAKLHGMALRNVTVKANELGARTAASTLGLASGNKGYSSTVLSFSVAGTYEQFRAFLADLEHSLRLVDVTGISFASNDKGTYDYVVDITTYWLRQ